MTNKQLAAFAIGVCSAPIAQVAAYAIIDRYDASIEYIRSARRKNVTFRDDQSRINAAASIMHAPRFHAVRLPGGMSFAWRSLTPETPEVREFAYQMKRAHAEAKP